MYGQPQIASGVLGVATSVVLGAPKGGTLAAAARAGTLPYTGLSLLWTVLLAATFVAVGASLLRASYVLRRIRVHDRPEYVPVQTREDR
jgi:hypothetical protein